MHAVLYTHQLEPITVVDLPMHVWDMLEKGQAIQLQIMEPVRLKPYEEFGHQAHRLKTVTIVGERIQRGAHKALMLFTRDEETALLLKAAFLPGQRSELREMERSAFASGFLDALLSYRG